MGKGPVTGTSEYSEHRGDKARTLEVIGKVDEGSERACLLAVTLRRKNGLEPALSTSMSSAWVLQASFWHVLSRGP